MEVDDRKRLQANHKDIVTNVRVKDVKDHLHQVGILSSEDCEEVSLSSITQPERTRRLLKILPRRGPQAFANFIDSLNEEYGYLVKQILETDITKVVLADDQDEVDYREKLNTLQAQLWQQTQLIVEFQGQIANLKSTVEDQKKREDVIAEKLSKTGLRHEMVAFMHYNDDRSLEEPDSGGEPGGSIKMPNKVLRPHTDPMLIRETAIEIGFDVMNFMSDPRNALPAKSQYMINMRRVVRDLLHDHSEFIHAIIEDLNVNEMNGYETLLRVADELFRGQINWGRIGVWYAFGGSVGLHCEGQNMPELGKWIAEFTGIYIGQNLLEWLKKNDGWNGLNKFVMDREQNSESAGSHTGAGSLGATLGAIGLVGLGLGAYAAYKSH